MGGGVKEPEALVFGAELRCQYGSTRYYLLTEDYASKGINGLPAKFVVTDCIPGVNIMPFGDCCSGGTCVSQWMLADKWINPDGQNEKFGPYEIITTASHLVCNACGMFILPVNSGQNSDIGKQLMLLAELDNDLLEFLMNPYNSIYTPNDISQKVLDMLTIIVNSELYDKSIFLMAQGPHDIMGSIILASIGHLAPSIGVGDPNSLLTGMENMITRTGIKTDADPRNLTPEMLDILTADSKWYAGKVANGGFYKWQEEHKMLAAFLADAVTTAAYAAIAYASAAGQQRNQGNSSYERDIRDAEIGQSNRGEGTGGNSTSGPVDVKPPPNATPEQINQVKQYVKGANEALNDGALSPTGRVSTKGALRTEASTAAAAERARAAAAGQPYSGHAGHVPDTTWTGKADPHSWLDLDPTVNTSIGGQANRYPIGYKPTEFRFNGGNNP